jgi:DNA modification methylase
LPKYFIYQGDAYNILDKLAPSSVDVVYTSPPPAFYEREKGSTDPDILGTEENTEKYMRHLFAILQKTGRVLNPTGSLWLQLADYHHSSGTVMMVPEQIALNMINNGWLLISPCIWSRADRAVTVGGNERRFMKDWEFVYWFVKSSDYYFNEDCGVNKTSVFDYPYIEPAKNSFTSGYPEELVNIAIGSTCPPNGTLLDPFAGTGTTGVVALKNNCYFIGIEIKVDVVQRIEQRLDKVVLYPSKHV